MGTRFHSVIFGLCKGIPSIAISYSGYKANIMKQFNMDKFMINIEDINNDNLDKLYRMVDDLVLNRDVYSFKINDNLKNVRDSIFNDPAFLTITEIIGRDKNVNKNG